MCFQKKINELSSFKKTEKENQKSSFHLKWQVLVFEEGIAKTTMKTLSVDKIIYSYNFL